MELVVESSVVVDEKSSAACAVTSWGGALWLAWTGSDTRLNLLSSPDGVRFGGKRTLAQRSSKWVQESQVGTSSTTSRTTEALGPALGATSRGLQLAWTGTDTRLNVWDLGQADRPSTLSQKSEVSPAMAAQGDDVVLAWTGTDRRLNLLYSRGGHFLPPPLTLPETSHQGPAVCTLGPDVLLAWTGSDRHLNLLASQQGAFPAVTRLDQTSNHAPAVTILGQDLVLAWTGSDRHLNLVVVVRGRPAGRPLVLDGTSFYGPALCTHGGRVVLAWTGSDRRLNVAHLRGPMDTSPPRDR